MHPSTEAPPRNPPNGSDRPLLQREFDHAEPASVDDPTTPSDDTADEPTADDHHGDTADGGLRTGELSGIQPDDDTTTTRQEDEPAAIDEPVHHDPTAHASLDGEPVADLHAAKSTSRDEPADPMPAGGPVTPLAAIWAESATRDLRERWREAQLHFVDDPRKSAGDIRDLVNETVDALAAALTSHREQLNSLPTNGDTEQYRQVVQRYRTLFERLLTL
jgi:hypothetical protein